MVGGNLTRGLLSALLLCWVLVPSAYSQSAAWLIDVEGAIGPATADHMIRGLQRAESAGADLVILRIDTPGGLDAAMRDMIKSLLASSIPVVAYVAPSGARAASAGTYLLYASHVAAMAPGTNLGAATPVQVGSPGLPRAPTPSQPAEPGEQGDRAVSGTAMERKLVNDASAYIESLARLRGRNAEWARESVVRGASLTANDALEREVVELLASDEQDLLRQLDGRQVMINDAMYEFATAGAEIYHHPVDWRSEFLGVITNPNIAYVLMLIGIYGLIIEFYNPGFGLPGVLGATCLLLALYAFQVLPISYAGLGLILIGIALMTAEALAPSFGVLGLGGITAFVVGSIMLMDTDLPGYRIALPMIAALALSSAMVLIFVLGMIVRARRREVVSGLEHLLGATATVERVSDGSFWVRLEGELWEASSEEPLRENDRVRVEAVDGLVLQVSRHEKGASDV